MDGEGVGVWLACVSMYLVPQGSSLQYVFERSVQTSALWECGADAYRRCRQPPTNDHMGGSDLSTTWLGARGHVVQCGGVMEFAFGFWGGEYRSFVIACSGVACACVV
jgi:hypothetical protein